MLATGAYDRQVPFPGWDLPGVITAGGAQALLKGTACVAGRRVVVAGTGPFLLPVAAGSGRGGREVVGVHEAAAPARLARATPAAPSPAHPAKSVEAAGYCATPASGTGCRTGRGRRCVAAHGDDARRSR